MAGIVRVARKKAMGKKKPLHIAPGLPGGFILKPKNADF
jgi:hypothetical protein